MTTFFKELFDYNHYCNQGLIAAMTDHAKDLSDRSIKLGFEKCENSFIIKRKK
jgi:hypothetical protein